MIDSEVMEIESDAGEGNKIMREPTSEDADSESELTEAEETPKPKRVGRNTLRRTG